MKSIFHKFYFYYIFLYILFLSKNIICKEYAENINLYDVDINKTKISSSMKPDSYIFKEDSFIKSDFDSEVIKRKIEKGIVQSEILNGIYVYEFYFSNINTKEDLIVNFYPLDCQIQIVSNDENSVNIQQISNFEYNAFQSLVFFKQYPFTL